MRWRSVQEGSVTKVHEREPLVMKLFHILTIMVDIQDYVCDRSNRMKHTYAHTQVI